MVYSTIKPPELELDKVTDGKARILAHWNPDGTSWDNEVIVQRDGVIFHQYEEKVITWTIPKTFQSGETTIQILTFQDAEAYISANAGEIMEFAQGSEINLRR